MPRNKIGIYPPISSALTCIVQKENIRAYETLLGSFQSRLEKAHYCERRMLVVIDSELAVEMGGQVVPKGRAHHVGILLKRMDCRYTRKSSTSSEKGKSALKESINGASWDSTRQWYIGVEDTVYHSSWLLPGGETRTIRDCWKSASSYIIFEISASVELLDKTHELLMMYSLSGKSNFGLVGSVIAGTSLEGVKASPMSLRTLGVIIHFQLPPSMSLGTEAVAQAITSNWPEAWFPTTATTSLSLTKRVASAFRALSAFRDLELLGLFENVLACLIWASIVVMVENARTDSGGGSERNRDNWRLKVSMSKISKKWPRVERFKVEGFGNLLSMMVFFMKYSRSQVPSQIRA